MLVANVDYCNMEEEQLVEHIKKLKNAEYFTECLNVIEYGLKRFNTSAHYYRTVFPMITSCYRSLNQPQKAIDFWMQHKQLFASCLSPALLTSLAAAYCDVGNFEMAKKCANKAYAIQGGSKNYATELSLVYKRIKKEAKDDTLL
jgi:tetratricopeptide (TPR) repeat protein